METKDIPRSQPAHPWVEEYRTHVGFGLQVFPFDTKTDPGRHLLAAGQLAESLGFDALFTGDQPSWGLEGWIPLAALAVTTERIRLGTNVTCIFYRHPVMLARLVADLDNLSQGRLILGLGCGWDANEFARFGMPFPPVREQQEAQEISLAPLTNSDVEAMLRAISALPRSIPLELPDPLYALTEGNPFFIEEILTSLVAAGELFSVNGRWERKPLGELHTPRSVQDAVQQRTDRLSQDARRVLTFAAVAGRRFDFGLLQALTKHDEDQLFTLIKELMAAQLVVEESAEQFAFRHALTRQAIYADLLVRERKALHRTVAETTKRLYNSTLEALCWLLRISVSKQAHKELRGKPYLLCGEGGKHRRVVIICAFLVNGYSK